MNGTNLRPAIGFLNALPAVGAAAQNVVGTISAIQKPSDAFYSTQWDMEKIHARDAWQLTTGTHAVAVAILDCGILYNFELWNNLVINEGEIPPAIPFIADVDGDGFITVGDLNSPVNQGIIGDCDGDGVISPGDLMYQFDSGNPECHGLLDGQDNDGLMDNPGLPTGPIQTFDDIIGIDFGGGKGMSGFGTNLDAGGFHEQIGDDCVGISHGTAVAGIIGAEGNNGFAIAGVNWAVRLIPVRFTDDVGQSEIDGLAPALEYASLRGTSVINLSWSVLTHHADPAAADLQRNVWNVFAAEFINPGIVTVISAGNEGVNCDEALTVCEPTQAAAPGMISVASTREDDRKEGSNFGASTIDIAAPGAQVPSLDGIFTDHVGIYQGTSFAAPHVSGAAALIFAANPQLRDQTPASAQAVVARILCGADVDTLLGGKVAGNRRLNLFGAMAASCP